jgi:hypothetical protein
MPSITIAANRKLAASFTIPKGQKATATISGSWKFDPNRPACGASGVGGPVNNNGFDIPGAAIGCCYWNFESSGVSPSALGWFTQDNQTITWGDTIPGDGTYYFQMNDNQYGDNSGSLTLAYTLSTR